MDLRDDPIESLYKRVLRLRFTAVRALDHVANATGPPILLPWPFDAARENLVGHARVPVIMTPSVVQPRYPLTPLS